MLKRSLALFALLLCFFLPTLAHADYTNRFSVGAGVEHRSDPSSTDFELEAEYEHRYDSFIGYGGFVNYFFSNPGITLIGLPEIFLHPFATEFYVSAAPIVEFGSGIDTKFGAHLGTRIPLPLGIFTLVPTFAIDFINGGRNYIIGLGLQF